MSEKQVIKYQNFARQTDINYSNKHFIECNFSQSNPDTIIYLSNCIIESSNMVNCQIIGSDNEIIDCNQSQVENID